MSRIRREHASSIRMQVVSKDAFYRRLRSVTRAECGPDDRIDDCFDSLQLLEALEVVAALLETGVVDYELVEERMGECEVFGDLYPAYLACATEHGVM